MAKRLWEVVLQATVAAWAETEDGAERIALAAIPSLPRYEWEACANPNSHPCGVLDDDYAHHDGEVDLTVAECRAMEGS